MNVIITFLYEWTILLKQRFYIVIIRVGHSLFSTFLSLKVMGAYYPQEMYVNFLV